MKNSNQLSFLPTDPIVGASAEGGNCRIFVPAGAGIEAGTFKSFRDVTNGDTAMMRQCLTGSTTEGSDSPLEEFMRDVLRHDLLVGAYFHPKRLEGLPPPKNPAWVPVTRAIRAARHAQSVADIQPEERRLTYLATLLHSCGLFYCSKNNDLLGLPVPPMGSECFRLARLFLLDGALQKLRTRHESMADTMAAVMDLPHGEYYDLDQVARVSSAIYLANLRLTGIWAPPRL